MTNENRNIDKEEWARRGQVALKLGATLSVLSLVAIMATHAPRDVADATVTAPEVAAAKATPNPAMPDGKLYYMPGEYELHAPASAEEQPSTF